MISQILRGIFESLAFKRMLSQKLEGSLLPKLSNTVIFPILELSHLTILSFVRVTIYLVCFSCLRFLHKEDPPQNQKG